jgi:prepilin-type N-terminal cleavage/methylation domain-containing protein
MTALRTARRRAGYTLMELLVSLTLAAVLLGLGAGAFLQLGKRTAYQQALADGAGLVNKVRNASVRFPAALVTDPEARTMYGRTEQVLQELRFEPRPGEGDEIVFGNGINGLEVDASLGQLVERGGRVGGGLRVSGSAVDCRDYAAYDVIDGISLEVWVQPERLTACTLIDKGNHFAVRFMPSRGGARVEARVGVDDKGMRDEAALTAEIPAVAEGEWVGIFVGYDRKALTISTDHGFGPVERKSIPETRPMKPDTDANLRVGADFLGVIDDFRFGGVTTEDPIMLAQDVELDGPGRTIHFRGGKLDGRLHPGVESIRLRSGPQVTVLEIGQSGTVQRVYDDSDGQGAPPEPASQDGGSGLKEE